MYLKEQASTVGQAQKRSCDSSQNVRDDYAGLGKGLSLKRHEKKKSQGGYTSPGEAMAGEKRNG